MLNGLNTTYKRNNQPNFGNGALVKVFTSMPVTKFVEGIKQSPVAEVVALDVGAMIVPRTIEDYNQNPDYGMETAFRETAPMLFNPYGPGIVAAIMLGAAGFKGVNANRTSINAMHKAWEKAGGKNFHPENMSVKQKFEIAKQYVKNSLSSTNNIKSYIGSIDNPAKNGFKPLLGKELDRLSGRIAAIIIHGDKMGKKSANKILSSVSRRYTEATGAASSLTVKNLGKEFSTNIGNLLNDTVSLGKVFVSKSHKKLGGVIEKLNKLSVSKTLWGTGLSVAGFFSLEFINKAITKYRTGKTGYIAYKDLKKGEETSKPDNNIKKEEKNNSTAFWGKKVLAAAGMGLLMVATMGGFKKGSGFFQKGGLKNFMKKIELKEKFAHMDSIKLIYGAGLMGRLLSSRDDQELKVSAIRDYSGFLNWLVLGPFVAKGIAHSLDKSLLNITGPIIEKGKPVFTKNIWQTTKNLFNVSKNWLGNVSQKSHSEFKAMAKKLPESKRLPKEAIYYGSIVGGVAYSLFMLGIGMPKFLNHLTNKEREKQLKEENGGNIKEIAQDKKEDKHNNLYSMNLIDSAPKHSFTGFSAKNQDLFSDFLKRMNA